MYDKYCDNHEAAWGYGNIVLYRMCLRDRPKHICNDTIAGKMLLIGRTYAASPERGSGPTPRGEEPDFFRWVVARLGQYWGLLDEQLDGLTHETPFDATHIDLILKIHQNFRQALAEATRPRVNGEPRKHTSFCSKYLHFHRPDHFPIYDSYVSAAIGRKTQEERRRFTVDPTHDERYSRFCQQVMMYRDKRGTESLRDLDRHLYECERRYRATNP